MKIGLLTITLIIFTLTIGFSAYVDKFVKDTTESSCEKLSDTIGKDSLYESSTWNVCLEQMADNNIKYGYKLLGTFIFFWLTLLSWRIDCIENKGLK